MCILDLDTLVSTNAAVCTRTMTLEQSLSSSTLFDTAFAAVDSSLLASFLRARLPGSVDVPKLLWFGIGTFLFSEAVWVLFNVPYLLIERNGWFQKYKIQPVSEVFADCSPARHRAGAVVICIRCTCVCYQNSWCAVT